MTEEWGFTAQLWRWEAAEPAAWFFLALPQDVSDDIEDLTGPRGGFGSVRVEVRVGGSTWRTSVFPDARRKTFVLPVKKAVRRKEDVEAGDTACFTLTVLD